MKITVSVSGSEHVVEKFAPVDLVAFEREFKTSASELGEGARFEWLCFLVYRGLIRQGVVQKKLTSFDDFLDTVDDLNVENEEEGADEENPTTAATPAS